MAGLLSRERIVAGPGFNRWLVPPAALAIHLCIGQAYAFSVFKLPLTKVIGIGQPGPGRLEPGRAGLDLLARDLLSRTVGGRLRTLARARRPPQERGGGRHLLVARLLHFGRRGQDPPALADVSRLRRPRRLRARHRVHHTGVHTDQVVSRPAWHGHRNGDHGVRRRRAHRKPALAAPSRSLPLGRPRSGVAESFLTLGAALPRVHAVRGVPVPGAGRRAGSPPDGRRRRRAPGV